MTNREYDEHCEQIMCEFLRKNFYEKYLCDYSYEKVNGRDLQIKGVDVILKGDNEVYYIDEKAAIRYVGLKTFALELSFINKHGNLTTGWLLDESKINDYYLFVWINELNDSEIKDISSIKDVDVALVSKESILEHLKTLGWTKEKLNEKQDRIRHGDTSLGNIKINGCKFAYSTHLYEQPINILLPKETYIELADVCEHVIQN